MWNIFNEAVTHAKVFCVLDAVDECDPANLSSLMKHISQSIGAGARFLMTGRPFTCVKDNLFASIDDSVIMDLHDDAELCAIKHGMDVVIHNRLARLGRKRGLQPPTIKLLRSQIQKVEYPTYLWMQLLFAFVEQGWITSSGIVSGLENIPRSIYDAYEAILSKSEDENETRRLLQIVCIAEHPLTVEELGSAWLVRVVIRTLRP